jgi:hypothetical protein
MNTDLSPAQSDALDALGLEDPEPLVIGWDQDARGPILARRFSLCREGLASASALRPPI